MSISHWGMFFGFWRSVDELGRPGVYRAEFVPAHPDEMVGLW